MSLKEKLETLKSLNSEIVELVPGELSKKMEQAGKYKENIFRAQTRIAKAQAIISDKNVTSGMAATTTSGLTTLSCTERVKLLMLTLLRFNSDVMKLTTF